ncbi:MAG: hypothetical protein ABJA02_04180 [Acidobacteriota bacterium]
MKKATAVLTILLFTFAAFGQQTTPLTQAEFVKMLYAVQKTPSVRVDIVEALRKRGIAFELTDGIRGLAKSKAGNDDELQRALEEADRRRINPEGRTLPSTVNAMAALESTRKNTLEAVGEMPDFVVKQQIQRSWAFANTNNFKNLDRLVVAVSYRSTGEEDYRVLSTNGILNTEPKTKQSYEDVGGTSSTGEFVTVLATVFKPESETKFDVVDTDVIRGRKAIVFDFSTTKEKAKQLITAAGVLTVNSTIAGMKGRIWIDRDDARVLRIESDATEIPDTFPVRSAKRVIDYDWVTIADEKYLLPSVSDVRLTSKDGSQLIETRNIIRFKDYQKYGTDVVIRDDDVQPDKDPIKP